VRCRRKGWRREISLFYGIFEGSEMGWYQINFIVGLFLQLLSYTRTYWRAEIPNSIAFNAHKPKKAKRADKNFFLIWEAIYYFIEGWK